MFEPDLRYMQSMLWFMLAVIRNDLLEFRDLAGFRWAT